MTADALAATLRGAGTLAVAIPAALRAGWSVAEVVVQDEYTHDVVLVAEPDGPAVILDAT